MELKKDIVLDKLLKVTPVGINIVDLKNNQLIQTSDWVLTHLGYSQEEFKALSQNLFEPIVHKDDREAQLQAYHKLMTDPEILFTECQIRYKKNDGEYVPALLRLSVLEMDENKVPKSALTTAIDITEVIALRERLKEELRKMDIISYKNSHELRGPVASILGLIQLIDYQGWGETISVEIINALKETVQKLDQVIQEINEHSY
jgi:PAS domain S-box-containing protein